jgi:hypothetical protein
LIQESHYCWKLGLEIHLYKVIYIAVVHYTLSPPLFVTAKDQKLVSVGAESPRAQISLGKKEEEIDH